MERLTTLHLSMSWQFWTWSENDRFRVKKIKWHVIFGLRRLTHLKIQARSKLGHMTWTRPVWSGEKKLLNNSSKGLHLPSKVWTQSQQCSSSGPRLLRLLVLPPHSRNTLVLGLSGSASSSITPPSLRPAPVSCVSISTVTRIWPSATPASGPTSLQSFVQHPAPGHKFVQRQKAWRL